MGRGKGVQKTEVLKRKKRDHHSPTQAKEPPPHYPKPPKTKEKKPQTPRKTWTHHHLPKSYS